MKNSSLYDEIILKGFEQNEDLLLSLFSDQHFKVSTVWGFGQQDSVINTSPHTFSDWA